MTDYDPNADVTTEIAAVGDATAAYPPIHTDAFPFAFANELGGEEWPSAVAKSGIRLRKSTAALLALILVAFAFWGGALLEKDQKSGGGAAGGFAALRAGLTGRTTAGSSGRTGLLGASGSSGIATGTVTDIIGNALYITETSGSLVKVTLSPSGTVTRNAKSSVTSLEPGDTVTISGSPVKDGSMTASSISATAQGVSSTAGFGGFGGFGGGSGATSRSGG